jgi:aryl-alcohol dehydrogenase-like predicted oxidoreductase
LEAVLGAVKEMVEEGLVLNVGLSNVSLSTLKRARKILPIATVRVKEPLYYSSVSEIFTLRIEKLHLAET